jgi:hypothetical protein
MSEMTQTAPQPTTDDAPLPGGESAEGSNRRTLLMVIGGAAVLVVLLAGWFLLHSGGGSPEATGVVTPGVPSSSNGGSGSSGGTGTQGGGGQQTVPPAYHGKTGTDPFKPLPGEQPKASTDGTTGTSGSTGTTGSTGSTGSTGTGTGSAAASAYQMTVRSVDVGGKSGTFLVNGVVFLDVKVGDTFADTFRLDSVGSSGGRDFVTLTFGDQKQPGNVYVGQTKVYTP